MSKTSLQSQGVIYSNGNLTVTYDATTLNWGKNWRMLTQTEIKELTSKCTWTTLNNVSGYNVVGAKGNSVFLPGIGYRSNIYLFSLGSYFNYWSSLDNDDGLHRVQPVLHSQPLRPGLLQRSHIFLSQNNRT